VQPLEGGLLNPPPPILSCITPLHLLPRPLNNSRTAMKPYRALATMSVLTIGVVVAVHYQQVYEREVLPTGGEGGGVSIKDEHRDPPPSFFAVHAQSGKKGHGKVQTNRSRTKKKLTNQATPSKHFKVRLIFSAGPAGHADIPNDALPRLYLKSPSHHIIW
jgi:hypothetical protein